MAHPRNVARRAAGTAFVSAAVVAGVTAGLSGIAPQSPGEITQLLLLVLLTSAAVAALVYGGVALATKNTRDTSEVARS